MGQTGGKVHRVLIVDDEQGVRGVLTEMLKAGGYPAESVSEGREALRALRTSSFDVMITDVRLPDISGLELLAVVHDKYPWLPVIVITGYATIDSTIKAMRLGAVDYIPKPFTRDSVMASVEQAIQSGLAAARKTERPYCEIVHGGGSMTGIMALIDKVSRSDATVLITGESGTGKELVARAIHRQGARARQPFVTVNSGALPEGLLESELFGHTRGAYTGAVTSTLGRFRIADGGTLFLDEVGNMSPAMQVKLLRVIQEQEFSPVGSSDLVKVDVRLITATNLDLENAVAAGTFREDLYYRLNVIEIHIPPLRERREDILPLADHFLARIAETNRRKQLRLSPSAVEVLGTYGWPGNVRELQNAMERASVLSEGEEIEAKDLPVKISGTGPSRPAGPASVPPLAGRSLSALLAEIEKAHIVDALEGSGWVRSKAAERLGMKRTTLLARMASLGITDPAGGGDG
ncbi:MAG TPA: sigma-54 dependent transcriptional regulator [Candidatus Fermentibacter sp.]|nr:sigma-54 dependent transcriptional regulator [Candidatus Fermentibacter sp.]